MDEGEQDRIDRYPAVLRGLHWARAVLILGMICAGWTMTRMPDEAVAKFGDFYPLHKSFGLLALLVVLVQLAIRARTRLPYPPAAL
ncbi:cytochrome b/b6 domain-containing protein, partial [Staphylococcus aureus]|nr:cytochrome b/b6 domain-containing protein [Staphylococcus aureus]